jgi:DNA invertase Pin-like site-specific DNA recombinase
MKKQKKEPIYAIIYARVASQGELSDAVKHQLIECRKFARKRGFILEKDSEYMDTNTESGQYIHRPGLQEILQQIDKSPERTFVLIVTDVSRIARNYEQYESYKAALASRVVAIESIMNKYDENPEEMLKKDIAWAMQRYEYNIRHQRAVEAIRQNKKN